MANFTAGALLASISCGFKLRGHFLPQLSLAALTPEARRGREESGGGGGGASTGGGMGEGAGAADGASCSQASFVYVLRQMWLIRGKCSSSHRPPLVGSVPVVAGVL